MGLFDKFVKREKGREKQTTKNVKKEEEEENILQKQTQSTEKPYDIESVKRFHSEKKKSIEINYEPSHNAPNGSNIEKTLNDTMEEWEKENHPLSVEEKIQVFDRFIEIMDEETEKLEKENMEFRRWSEFLYKNNQQALKYLGNRDMEKATSILEENTTALADTPATYSYLVDIYRLNEDYDNELRICNQAIDLIPSPKKEDYIIRKEEVIKRKNNERTFSDDEELSEIIKREEKFTIKTHLIGYAPNKEEQKVIQTAKKEYLEKNPTNFLLIGTNVFGKNWSSLCSESEEMKTLLTLTGEAKYLEEMENYKKALSVYEEANKIAKKIDYYRASTIIDKRMSVCNNKIKKQEIKDLENKAKELEKTEPAQAIELYNELNILNPNLKKYNKRIEILNKK